MPTTKPTGELFFEPDNQAVMRGDVRFRGSYDSQDDRRKKVFDLMLSIVHGECTEVTLEEAFKYGHELIYGKVREKVQWKCVKCDKGFEDGELFAIVTPASYNAELNDIDNTGRKENHHYRCLIQGENNCDRY